MESFTTQSVDRHGMLTRSNRVQHELSFAMYAAASRMIRLHTPLLEPLGLTFPQYLVLLQLYGGTPATVGALGSALEMDAGTITPLLKRLEKAGLVTRQRDAQDERRVLINLSKAGEELRRDVLAVSGRIKSACRRDTAELAELRDTLNSFARPATG